MSEQETVKQSQKFYLVEITDPDAKRIEKRSQEVVKLSEIDGLPGKIKDRLVKIAKQLHVSSIYMQRGTEKGISGAKSVTKEEKQKRRIALQEKLDKTLSSKKEEKKE